MLVSDVHGLTARATVKALIEGRAIPVILSLSGQQRERGKTKKWQVAQKQRMGQTTALRVRPSGIPKLLHTEGQVRRTEHTQGTQEVDCGIAHKMLHIVFAMLKSNTPYRDRVVDYEALSVQRNAPRWIKMLVKHDFMSTSE